MPPKRSKHSHKRSSHKRSSHKHHGGGWSDGGMVSPGNPIHTPYPGPGKDCAGLATPPGFLSHYSPRGLPGLMGGTRKGRKRSQRIRGGTHLGVAAHEGYVESAHNTANPAGFPDTTGANAAARMSMPGVPVGTPAVQSGGRWGSFPELGPLNPMNAVGASSYAPIGRIACESGTYNPLNPNRDLQLATTAPLNPPVMHRMAGGSAMSPAPFTSSAGSGSGFSSANFPQVAVGAADSMRYNAPTAGYRNDFQAFPAGGAVGGLTLQTPYAAGAFNRSCITTGGQRSTRRHRRRHSHGGGHSVADSAAAFRPVQASEVMSRAAFDGTHGGLPVKYGGRRRSQKRSQKKQRKQRKQRQ